METSKWNDEFTLNLLAIFAVAVLITSVVFITVHYINQYDMDVEMCVRDCSQSCYRECDIKFWSCFTIIVKDDNTTLKDVLKR